MKILMLTLHSQNNNFGSVLQANSLYQYMKKLGHDVTVLNYRPYYSNGALNPKLLLKKILINTMFLPQFIRRTKRFNSIIDTEKTTKKYTRTEQLNDIAEQYDIFMIGSDQVWNPTYLCGKDSAYVLKFTNSAKKMAYAASIGTDMVSNKELEKIVENIKDFKFVSVREKTSAVQLRNAGRPDTQFVLDPVFLFDKEYYKRLQKKSTRSGYILAYVIHKDPLIEKVIEVLAEKMNKKVIQVGGFASKCKYDEFPRSAGPAEFLGLIDGADLVVTSSFHGLAFSHIYHKQFWVVLPHGNTLRLTNILEAAGTMNRIVEKIEDLDEICEPIDYEIVDEKLGRLKKQSRDFLCSSLLALEEM